MRSADAGVAAPERTLATDAGDERRVTQASPRAWSWQWTGWASWPVSPSILALAVVVVALDVASAWTSWPSWYLGRVLVSPALPVAALLVARVGWARVGGSRAMLSAWREFLVGASAVLLVCVVGTASTPSQWHDIEGVIVSVVGEEIVYRLAAVLVLGALCARVCGRDWHDTATWGTGPIVVGLFGAAALFSALPGHVEQVTNASNIGAFLSLSLLLGYAALRTGSLLPGMIVHAVLDAVTIAFFAGAIAATARTAVAATTLTALVLGLMIAGRRLGLRRRLPDEIDLRSADVAPFEVA